jgi:hypothetical protein
VTQLFYEAASEEQEPRLIPGCCDILFSSGKKDEHVTSFLVSAQHTHFLAAFFNVVSIYSLGEEPR